MANSSGWSSDSPRWLSRYGEVLEAFVGRSVEAAAFCVRLLIETWETFWNTLGFKKDATFLEKNGR